MTIVITLGLHMGCIGGFFTAGIFGNFYTKRGGGIFDFQNGNSRWPCPTPIPAKILGCFIWSRSVMLGSVESEVARLIGREIIFTEFQPI